MKQKIRQNIIKEDEEEVLEAMRTGQFKISRYSKLYKEKGKWKINLSVNIYDKFWGMSDLTGHLVVVTIDRIE